MIKCFITVLLVVGASTFSIRDGLVIDKEGRAIIFHGVNVVLKQKPYLPKTQGFSADSFSQEDIAYLKKMGFNGVRLGIIWEAVEKSPGKYDDSYLNSIFSIAKMLKKADIGFILDLHQDLFSRALCGEGVPHFYMKHIGLNNSCLNSPIQALAKIIGLCQSIEDLELVYENGLPTYESCSKHSFFHLHGLAEFNNIYSHLYENKHGLLDKFIEMWLYVLKKLDKADLYSHLIAIDAWNEPAPKNMLSDYKNQIPGFATNTTFSAFYNKVFQALSLNEEFKLLISNSPMDSTPLFGGINFAEYKKLPAGKENRDHQILNIHYYCLHLDPAMWDKKEPPLYMALNVCRDFYSRRMAFDKNTANKLGSPMMITEFGACTDSLACREEIRSIVDNAHLNLVSWFYWNYKPYGDHTTTGGLEEGLFDKKMKPQKNKFILSRPYCQKYQGKPISSNLTDNSYETTFELAGTASSVIYTGEASIKSLKVTVNDKPVQFDQSDSDSTLEVKIRGETGKARISLTFSNSYS